MVLVTGKCLIRPNLDVQLGVSLESWLSDTCPRDSENPGTGSGCWGSDSVTRCPYRYLRLSYNPGYNLHTILKICAVTSVDKEKEIYSGCESTAQTGMQYNKAKQPLRSIERNHILDAYIWQIQVWEIPLKIIKGHTKLSWGTFYGHFTKRAYCLENMGTLGGVSHRDFLAQTKGEYLVPWAWDDAKPKAPSPQTPPGSQHYP